MTRLGVRETEVKHLSLILVGGLLIGLTASLPLAIVWPYPVPPPAALCVNAGAAIRLFGIVLPLGCPPVYMFLQPLVWGSWIATGALVGLIAHRLAGRGSRILVAALGGFSFLVAGFIGSQVVDTLPNVDILPNMDRFPIMFLSDIGIPFAIMTFGVSLTFALAVGLALRVRGLLWRAFLAAVVTGICYYVVTWILMGHAVMLVTQDPTTPPLADSLPAFGRPMGPMIKTVTLSNLIAGTVGGWAILILVRGARTAAAPTLSRAPSERTEQSDVRAQA